MDELFSSDFDFNNFEKASLEVLSQLVLTENIDVKIIDCLREMHLEYYTLLGKYKIAEEKSNIDSKTSLLIYKEEFLVDIIRTISRYWKPSEREGLIPMTYIRIDLDNFRALNNRYGHAIGDLALISVAKTLKKLSRPTDYMFRFGGEEFDIVLPLTSMDGAVSYLNKIIKAIRNITVLSETGEEIKVTASMGVSIFEFDFSENKAMIFDDTINLYHKVQKEADYAVYEAKLLGKDRYCIYDSEKDYKKIMESYNLKHNS